MKWQVTQSCKDDDFSLTKTVEAADSQEAKSRFLANMSPTEDKLYLKHLAHEKHGGSCEIVK